jgi:glycosyltransferase involved in cell wall biosynthesis
MVTIAFNYIDGHIWRGGYNYLLNLFIGLSQFSPHRVRSVVFAGLDINREDLIPFELIRGVKVVQSSVFNSEKNSTRLFRAIVVGSDQEALNIFLENKIDIVFESAQFYGWHFPLPILTWIPDFQHRHLKKLFSWKAFWKREIGFRLQALSGRHFLLSSNDAKYDCEKFYPSTRGHTTAVNFCVPTSPLPSIEEGQKITDMYGLPRHFFFLPNQFWAHKNHICVINALSKLKDRSICPVIVCSGKKADERDPNYFKRIQDLICANGLEGNLKLLGVIPSAHISVLMMNCAALINPSTFEGWSTTVEEAKAIGTPMILSRINVHKEQSNDAIFFDPHSSEQLSIILENFNPLSSEERDKRRKEASGTAASNFQKFANEFTNLIEREVKNQRGLRVA